MIFNVEQNEAQFILNVISELPTKSGAWPLLIKLQGQMQNAAASPSLDTPAQEYIPASGAAV